MKILNGLVFINGKFEKKDIRITDGKFSEIAEPGKLGGHGEKKIAAERLADEQSLDATGHYILPGLVDVHTHGRIGEDFSLATEDGLRKLLASYAACGVTSVLGTTMTNEPFLVERSLHVLGEYIGRQHSVGKAGLATEEATTKKARMAKMVKENSSYARLLGVHMEGPFFGKEKRGAHDAAYLQLLDWNRFESMQELSGGNIRLLTIDPSLSGAEEFIKKCCENEVKVSLGHTACDYETAVKARQAGADHVTHVFNGMGVLHHREPGLPGAALDTGMYTELICDGIHVHPAVVRLLFAAHPEQVVLISDSISAAGMPDGEYVSGGFPVVVEGGRAVLKNGTIAGSTVSLFVAMVNAIRFGVPAEQAVNSATFLPAKSIEMEEYVGSIALGRWADFLVVDEAWQLNGVYLAGNCIIGAIAE